jgi:hypothetical protein
VLTYVPKSHVWCDPWQSYDGRKNNEKKEKTNPKSVVKKKEKLHKISN